MHGSHSRVGIRKLSIGLAFFAGLLLCGLYASSIPRAHAQELPDSTPTPPVIKATGPDLEIPVVVTPTADAYEPDDDSSSATVINDGNSQTHSIYPAGDQDWVQFQLSGTSSVMLQASVAPVGSVEMALYDSTATNLLGTFQACGTQANLQAGTYYVKVTAAALDATVAQYKLGFKIGPDSYEPDCTPAQAAEILDGETQTHSIDLVGDQDYLKFTLSGLSSITLQTSGPNPTTDDTLLRLYNSSLQELDFNDDQNPNVLYSYIQRCGASALPAGTYYARVVKRLNDATIGSYGITFKINPNGPSSCIANTEVRLTGQSRGSYWVHPETAARASYALNFGTGPVRVRTLDNVKPLIASMGVYLKKTAGFESYSEFIGVPNNRLTDTYYFPWYRNDISSSGLASQLCFANVGTATADITVTIGNLVFTYPNLAIHQARCVSYANLSGGPVKVKSTSKLPAVPKVPIVASLSTRMKNNPSFTSYTEFGGLSASDTYSTDYMFPVYSNLTSGTLASQLRFTNVGSSNTYVAISLKGVRQALYVVRPMQTGVVTLGNVDKGPVHVQSLSAVPISASMIVKLKSTANYASYTEFMGLPQVPANQTRFVFPWYNNLGGDLVSQLRIANLGNTGTTVSVTIAGSTIATVSLAPRTIKIVSYPVNKGPVVLQSGYGVPIMASMMTYLKKGYGYTSYSEFIGQPGLPDNQLLPSSWFPWYDNASAGNFVSQLRFALPLNP